jgi:hypothetical protein
MKEIFLDFDENSLATASVRSLDCVCGAKLVWRFCFLILTRGIYAFWNNLVVFMLCFVQIAQVHRATLIDGREVLVKVQHEDIKAIILEVLRLFCVWVMRC